LLLTILMSLEMMIVDTRKMTTVALLMMLKIQDTQMQVLLKAAQQSKPHEL
jgi:hypothetical protein